MYWYTRIRAEMIDQLRGRKRARRIGKKEKETKSIIAQGAILHVCMDAWVGYSYIEQATYAAACVRVLTRTYTMEKADRITSLAFYYK